MRFFRNSRFRVSIICDRRICNSHDRFYHKRNLDISGCKTTSKESMDYCFVSQRGWLAVFEHLVAMAPSKIVNGFGRP